MDKIDEASDIDNHQQNRNGYGYERLASRSTSNNEGFISQSKSKSSRCLPVFESSKKPTAKRLAPEVVTSSTCLPVFGSLKKQPSPKRSLTPEVVTTTTTGMSKSESVRGESAGQVNNDKKLAKTHPLYNMSDLRQSKKALAKPEFLRYMEYVKEGGSWNLDSNHPVIYFK